jgi:hypothetical protein
LRQQRGEEPVYQPNSADKPVGPAILVNAVGQGKVVCVAGAPDFASAGEHPIPEVRALLRNVVRYLHPAPVVEVTAPQNVEAVVMQDETTGALLVHLLGYQSPPQYTPSRNRPYVLPALIEDTPMYRARITVRQPSTKAAAHSPRTQVTVEGQTVEVVVDEVHEVVEIR